MSLYLATRSTPTLSGSILKSQAAVHYIVDCGVDGDCPVIAVTVLPV